MSAREQDPFKSTLELALDSDRTTLVGAPVSRFQLLSLEDMKQFNATRVGAALACLSEAVSVTNAVEQTDRVARQVIAMITEQAEKQDVNFVIKTDGPLGKGAAIAAFPIVVRNLNLVADFLSDAPLTPRLLQKAEQIRKEIEEQGPEKFNAVAAQTRLLDFTVDVIAELEDPQFLCIAPAHRELYEQKEPPFGVSVADKFPDAARDVAAAARCLALNEWTACVSHLMRALESPLQLFARRIGVSFPSPTDLENWKTIVDQMLSRINAEAKRLEGTPKTHERNAELKFLGSVALEFRHFKNTWRNGVAHGRDWYDERDAEAVFRAVKSFMQTMADGA